jgi:hypothetical protein
MAYGTLAVLGITVNPFFFVFHLSEIFFRYPSLKAVIRSVYDPRDQIGMTYILYLILNYIFAVWGFT